MHPDARTVLVTGIGGNVGQGILRNIARLGEPIRLVGTNVEAVSAGNHLCDAVHALPYADAPDYVDAMLEVCRTEGVELVIPSTDLESYHLALASDRLPPLAASPAETALVFLDKFRTYEHCAKQGIPFAPSVLPRDYRRQFPAVIVKPRQGRGSRELYVDPPQIEGFSSEEFVVQRLYSGKEITTAFYVTRAGAVHGHITLERTLSAGTTNSCFVARDHDAAMARIVAALAQSLAIRGSCNIQSIVCDDGAVVPFEVNGRISGTNSIRANFGFEDVRYTVQEYLYGRAPAPPTIRAGAAVRILMDVIYPGAASIDEIKDGTTPHYLY